MEARRMRMAEVHDMATGYNIVIEFVENADYSIEYEMQVFKPNPAEGEDGLVDTTVSVPLRSDGVGPLTLLG